MGRITHRVLMTQTQAARYYQVQPRVVRLWREKGAVETVPTPGGRPRVLVEVETTDTDPGVDLLLIPVAREN